MSEKDIQQQQPIIAFGVNNIGCDQHGATFQTIVPSTSSPTAKDDEDIHKAIAELYVAVDEKGERIFTEQGQWYAVYRVLKEYCNYSEKMTDFVSLIKKNKWAEDKPYCKYDSIKSVNTDLPLLAVKVSLWQQYKSINEKYAKQCVVAEKLMKLLEII